MLDSCCPSNVSSTDDEMGVAITLVTGNGTRPLVDGKCSMLAALLAGDGSTIAASGVDVVWLDTDCITNISY